jgi:hypothetical protein
MKKKYLHMLQANNDADELFKIAADNYPLKTDNADWKKVRIKLSLDNINIKSPPKRSKKHFQVLLQNIFEWTKM